MPLVLALPELLEILAVIAILLIGIGPAVRVGQLLAEAFRQIPVIGAQIADVITTWVTNIAIQAKAWSDGAAKTITDAVDFITGTVQSIVRTIANGIALAHYVSTVLGSLLTNVTGAFISTSAALWARIAGQAATIAQLVVARIALTATVGGIIAYRIPAAIYQAVATAGHAAAAALTAAELALQVRIAAVAATAHALVSAEESARRAADAALRAVAAADAAAVERALSAQVAALDHVIGAEIGTVGQAIDGVAAKVGPWAGPLTIAGTITAITAEVERIARCADPLCNTFSNDLSFLNALTSGAMLGIVAELVAQAAQNPEAAAAETVNVAGSIVGGAASLFSELTGVRA